MAGMFHADVPPVNKQAGELDGVWVEKEEE